MKTIFAKTLALTAFVMLAGAQTALAGPPDPDPVPCEDLGSHVHDCAAQLSVVFNTIGGALSVSDRDESKLQSKVCAADDKLHIEPVPKTDDAILKLQNIIDTVNSKAKISAADAAEITYDAMDAQDCISSL